MCPRFNPVPPILFVRVATLAVAWMEHNPMCRPLLILDLDETLIYPSLRPLGHREDFFCEPYYIYTRPFFDQFLDTCRQSYNLAVWTRSDDDYARCVKEHIFDHVQLEIYWTRSQCTERFVEHLMPVIR
jgi:hypothetical protein